MSFLYLASPYTKRLENGEFCLQTQKERYDAALRALAWLTCKRIYVFSPIVHTHDLARVHKLPTTFEFWQTVNHNWIRSGCGVIVLAIDGWEESRGVKDEIDYAHKVGRTLSLLVPNGSEYRFQDLSRGTTLP